jgi:Ca2+/Na+ antiporter
VLPRWTGITLIVGMVLMAVTVSLPDLTQTLSAAVRDIAFVGMGAAVVRRVKSEHRSVVSLTVGASG